ncbi:MAG: hypothetical protein H0W99_07855 [Acidobacteria bacterium]|nr:hypothetical protein [Acidobacteriota bacterium]
MTGEEMERAIGFLLKSQANFEARQAAFEERQTAFEAQQKHTDAQIQALAETMAASLTVLAEAQSRTDARLNRLIALFEQHITVGH